MRGPGLSLAFVLLLPAGLAEEPPAEAEGFAERPETFAPLVDEDEEFAPQERTYAFNPVQARNELKVGNFYAKKGSHRAAEKRYVEATRWDPNFAEAYWRLGVTREKLAQAGSAVDAYQRYLLIEPNGNKARDVRRRLAKLESSIERVPLAAENGPPAGDL